MIRGSNFSIGRQNLPPHLRSTLRSSFNLGKSTFRTLHRRRGSHKLNALHLGNFSSIKATQAEPSPSSRGRSESKLSYQFYWWGRLLSPISKKNPKYKVGYRVELAFLIHLCEKDYVLIEEIKNLFSLQVGSLHRSLKAKSILFKVYSVKDLRVIKNHFDKYPMITRGTRTINYLV